MSGKTFLSRLAWPAVGAACIGVAGFGLYVSLHALSAAKTWEGRYYAVAAENQELKEQLAQVTAKKVEMVFSVGSHEYAPKSLARANRNLLNIKKLNKGKWLGEIGVDKHSHVIFSHPAYSVRAGAMILKNYEERHGISTIEDMIDRFCEGNKPQYVSFICKHLGVKPRQKISLKKNLHKLLPIMIKFETGESIGIEYTEIINAVIG